MFYRKDLLKSNFELSPYLTVLPEYSGLGLGLMKKRAVAELTVMTSMRARVSMVRGCMLLAGHHPPHWCRCHHLTCDMSCVDRARALKGNAVAVCPYIAPVSCATVPDSAVHCHLTMQGANINSSYDFYKSKLPKTKGLKTS